MAFDPKNLSALAYGNGFTLWHYRTADAAAAVDTAGYFNPAASQLQVGDFIMAHVGVGGAVAFGLFVVNANAAGVVDVADMNAFGGTDTD